MLGGNTRNRLTIFMQMFFTKQNPARNTVADMNQNIDLGFSPPPPQLINVNISQIKSKTTPLMLTPALGDWMPAKGVLVLVRALLHIFRIWTCSSSNHRGRWMAKVVWSVPSRQMTKIYFYGDTGYLGVNFCWGRSVLCRAVCYWESYRIGCWCCPLFLPCTLWTCVFSQQKGLSGVWTHQTHGPWGQLLFVCSSKSYLCGY